MCIRVCVLALVIILLAGAAVGVAIAAGVFKSPEVVSASHAWGEVNETSTTIVTDIVINNPNPVGFALGRTSVVVEIRFNEVLVGRAKSEGIDLEEGESQNRVITRIDNTEIPDWWATHIAAGEHTTWTLNVKLEAPIFGRTVSVPVTNETGLFSTHILERINAYNPDPVGFGSFFVDVTETRFSWTNVTEEQSTLSGVVLLQNSTPISLEVVSADYSLTLNGIEIGQGAAAPDIEIVADAVTEIPMSFTVDHARLGEWWPTHIANGEQSAVDVEIGLTIGGTLPEPIGRLQVRLPVITVTDTLQTDILKQEEGQQPE